MRERTERPGHRERGEGGRQRFVAANQQSIASKGKKAHGGREATKPATDGSDPKPDAEQGPGVEPTPERVPANGRRAAVTET
jgi:hypothetical protein